MKLGATIDAVDELMHRQVHPKFVVGGRITSEVFQPTKKDKGLLSVNRGSMRSAAEAHQVFVGRGWSSWGTLSVAISEVVAQGLTTVEAPLDVVDDPEDLFDDPTHAVIDFRSLNADKKLIERRARKLRDVAVARGAYEGTQTSRPAAPLPVTAPAYEIEAPPVLRAAEASSAPTAASPKLALPGASSSSDDPER